MQDRIPGISGITGATLFGSISMLDWISLIVLSLLPRRTWVPKVKVNGVELFYKESGRGPETVIFSHGLLMDHSMLKPSARLWNRSTG